MSSLKDVARLAGVSVGTVSRYLNDPEHVREKTRNVIETAVQSLNYSPNAVARSLRRGRTSLVMVVVWAVGDPFYGDVIHGISEAAARKGYSIYIKEVHSTQMVPSSLDDIVLSRQADGVILLGGPSPFDVSEDFRTAPGTPPVVVAGEIAIRALSGLPAVRIDNLKAATDITRFLLGLGHKSVAFMSGEPGSILMIDREEGFRRALREAGLPLPDDYFTHGDLTIAGARRATRELLGQATPPTALICANDEMAIGAIAEARSLGLSVPDDLSVVGFDDIRYADVISPRLTTVGQPASLIGEQSFGQLWRLLQAGELKARTMIVPHRLVVRDSAAPPRRAG
ncbi:LacI family DNA-binding transcriptional regulator [Methylobrevis albus]|uniref:LacI family DNA-binding transcriptional regulator n=1 Tax=Methylobrevis albus TaxID=2793297 RepID=A0A931N136_9HYPH|nr:LacI family DNA-binding transcriptional regulator [Methylobrevis albus]MBH0239889.1 LacI family DNA-binding transcriptional regulator [Methylobrevis albus]